MTNTPFPHRNDELHCPIVVDQLADLHTDTYDSDALGRTTKTPADTFTYTPYDLPKRFVPTSGSAVDYLYDTLKGDVVKNVAGGDQDIGVAGLFLRHKELGRPSATNTRWSSTASGRNHRASVQWGRTPTWSLSPRPGPDPPGPAANATAVARSANRDPFGNQVGTGTPFLPSDANTIAGGGFHGFQSQRHDLRAGLIDMNGRYYNPRIGRFMSNDSGYR